MKSTEDIPSDQQYFLNAVAPSGRSIEPCVFLVAQGIANQAVSYTEKLLGDSCVAVNLLEEAAATVSEVIRAKEAAQIAPIRDVRRYLFRVFLRKVAEARRNETTYQEASQWYSHPRDDNAARVRFSKALQWLRTSVETSRNGSRESTLSRTKKYYRPRDREAQRVTAFERRLDRMFTPAFYQEFHQLLGATKSTGSL